MKAAQNFNYNVALAAGLRSLQAGRLRQAEEQFRYLATKFPAAEGGYRGLAKVLVELEDRLAALATLREGATALARSGDRGTAIALLREAVMLDPRDLTSHRHLAASLALAGQRDASVEEYVRFSAAEIAGGDMARARSEVSYALDTLGSVPALLDFASRIGVVPRERPKMRDAAPVAEEPAREPAAAAPGESDPRLQLTLEATAPEPSAPADLAEREARAADYIAEGDPRAAQTALASARAYLAAGRIDAASDLLLQLVVSGLAVHDAQRLLIDVARGLGKREIATAKAVLLAQVLRLEGREELAHEVESLAQRV